MSVRKLLHCGAVVAVLLTLAVEARAQPKFLRRAVVNSLTDSRRPTLLDETFTRGGAAFSPRGAASLFRAPRSRPVITRGPNLHFYSDGTAYDPYQQASLINRYLEAPPNWNQPAANGTSSNVANVYAPASYQVPGMPSGTPPLTTALSQPLSTPIGPGGAYVTGNIVQTNIGLPLSATSSMNEALWQRRELRRSLGDLPSPTLPPSQSLPRAGDGRPAPSEKSRRQIDHSLRSAARAFQQGDYDQARESYVQAMVHGCSDTRARLGLGLAEFARGRFAEAAAALQAELAGAPNLDRSGLDLRHAYGKPHELDLQLSALEQVAPNDDAAMFFLLGYVRYFTGDRAGGAEAWRSYRSHPDADPALVALLERLARDGTSFP